MSLCNLCCLSLLVANQPAPATDLRAEVDGYLNPLTEMNLFSGSVLLAKDGEVVVQGGWGKSHFADDLPILPETRFKLMSVTKAVTATAVMTLQQRGELDLSNPVADHLPHWPAAWKNVTLRHLASHTSGIPNLEHVWVRAASETQKRGLEIWPRVAAELTDYQLASPPGESSSYSNFNFILLGLVVEAVSGQPYPRYLRSAVLDPAGMEHSGIDDGSSFPGLAMGYFRGPGGTLRDSRQDMSVIQAAGGLYSTVLDLYRLDRALHGDSLLDAKTRELLFTPVTENYACGWQVTRELDRHCIHHSGGANGFVADFLRFPEQDACVIVLSNFAFAPISQISHDLAAILFGEPHDSPRVVPPEALEVYGGIYRGSESSTHTLVVRRSGSVLLAFDIYPRMERCGARMIIPIGEHTFSKPNVRSPLRFEPDEKGEIKAVRLSMGEHETVMERTSVPPNSWSSAVGSYRMEPALGDSTEIVREPTGLVLRTAGGWPPSLELAPVSATEAMALYDEAGGTILRVERDAAGTVQGFHWQRADGTTFHGTREDR